MCFNQQNKYGGKLAWKIREVNLQVQIYAWETKRYVVDEACGFELQYEVLFYVTTKHVHGRLKNILFCLVWNAKHLSAMWRPERATGPVQIFWQIQRM